MWWRLRWTTSSPPGETVASEPFTTEPPKLLKVRVIPDSETMATATVTITGHNGTAQRVNLRYRTAQQGATPPGAWSSPVETADPTGESATIALSGLTGGTLYDVEGLAGPRRQPRRDNEFHHVAWNP